MATFKQLICPISTARVDENKVRATALEVVLLMGLYFMTGHVIFPVVLVGDFGIRAFTSMRFSPLSFLAHLFVRSVGTQPVWIDKAPKVFAARVGFLLSVAVSLAAVLGMPLLSALLGATLVLFAFLECGLNFCAGCWVYTYVVYPLVRKGD
jgi:hypothetical protein